MPIFTDVQYMQYIFSSAMFLLNLHQLASFIPQ